jgi:DNA-binding CsgD family transcriptional regulator
METESLINQKAQPAVVIDIVTANHYLGTALSLLASEHTGAVVNFFEKEGRNITRNNQAAVRLCLMDIDFICAQRGRWGQLSERITLADSVTFLSFSKLFLYGIPHLCVSGPLERIRETIGYMINNMKKNASTLTYGRLVSSLNAFEQDVFLFLMSGKEAQEISLALRVSDKSVYRIKSQVMKKFEANDRRDLHKLLNLGEFMRSHRHLRFPDETNHNRFDNIRLLSGAEVDDLSVH